MVDDAKQPRNHAPYGSARDLPSYQDMARSIHGLKSLSLLVSPDVRSQLVEIEHEMNRLAEVVDLFYDRLGERNWIFPDALSLDGVELLLRDNPDPSAAEQALIDLYREPETHKYWVMRLTRAEGLSARRHQIRRALKHYEAAEFDSCVLHLLAVMDGFVNDFDPELRKGLAARDPDEMTAWDSVVGHHLGLTHALKAFRRTIKKRVDEETFELHRHGIMHGSITHFDNPVVATKAWNMLFAVADWATATMKAQAPQPEEPSIVETMQQIRRNKAVRSALDAWKPAAFAIGDKGFAELEITLRTRDFLEVWRKRNFGAMVSFESRSFVAHKRESQVAGDLRDRFDGYELEDFEVQQVENSAPAVWIARGTATVNGTPGSFECRWVSEDPEGRSGFASDAAEWRLLCTPSIWSPLE
jgi:hypothetical protein